MDGRLGISRAIKLLDRFNGQTKGIEGIRLLFFTYLSSNEKTVIAHLRTLGNLGVLTEITQGHFKINTNIRLDDLDLIDKKIEEELKI